MTTRASEGPSTAAVARVIVTILGILLVAWAAWEVRNVLVLVLISGFLAVGLDPAVRKLESLSMRRGLAVTVIFLTALIFIAGFALAVVPPLVRQVASFADNLPEYVEDLANRYPQIDEWVRENNVSERLEEAVSDLPQAMAGSFGNVVGVAGSVMGALFNFLTIMILTIYFLVSLQHIREGTLRLVPKSRRARASELLEPILQKIGGYIAGQVTVALIAGTLAGIFLAIVGMPYPVALALWVALSALIPLVGATLGAIPAIIVGFVTSLPLGLGTLIYFIVYQQIENYVIAPRIMTRAVDISPAAVLTAALIGGNLVGFAGALMAIPVAASLKLIFQEVVLPRAEVQ